MEKPADKYIQIFSAKLLASFLVAGGEMKLARKISLNPMDFGSSAEPWAIQEPQTTTMELTGRKDFGFSSFSGPSF